MAKEIKFDAEARQKLLDGATIIKNAVAATLGPRGNNVAIARPWGTPAVIHDGVTVAREIDLPDPFENMGAQLIKEAAQRTNDYAGDGTTTAIVLAHAILAEGHKNVAAGANAMLLRRGIQAATENIVKELEALAQPVKTAEAKQQVATISAQDDSIGKIISLAIEKVGDDGVITVEETGKNHLSVEYKEGMQFDRGWPHQIFVNNPDRMEAEIKAPVILVCDMVISDYNKLMPVMQLIVGDNKKGEIVIIARDIVGTPLEALALNRAQNNLPLLPLQAPGVGDAQGQWLQDIAVLTGAKLISETGGAKLENTQYGDLGKATRVTAGKNQTVIVGGGGDPEKISSHVAYLQEQSKRSELNEFEREVLRERIAKLTTGIAIINVGANTEAETRERKERVIDAVAATKAAIAEGIVAGGETALIRAATKAAQAFPESLTQDDERKGYQIVLNAARYPFDRLLENAGMEAAQYAKEITGNAQGVDVYDQQVKDLLEAGVVDPMRVTKTALQNAAATAATILTTNVVVVPKPEENNGATTPANLPR